ncbi:Histone transcription regulator 3 [Entomortierella chlamydospora]|uniref:Histone transcription regulator 3 n=1 Tax=Entomortierella chlamydospora TaxID=101097 RepID=A0A9P6MUX9_9FUNG|nr:Histone transcription regulator 3 [Entomortierella chlamydospora]KAG0014385.1 Histone transcription regulator 3 [Entomortierella chlamydospora]
MIRFAVLNEEEQPKSKDEESVEIQAEKCLGVYESAIRLLQKNQLEESRKMLKNLIESDLMQKFDSNSEIAARGTPLRRLQYLVYTNYAYILEQVSDGGSALQFYLKAVMFDNSDNSLWVKIGILAAKEKRLKLARYSLECALQQQGHDGTEAEDNIPFDALANQDLTPSQWTCLETLCEVLYEIGDFIACEDYIQRALRISPYFERGLKLLDLIRSRLQGTPHRDNLSCIPPQPQTSLQSYKINEGPKELFLDDISWLSLGECLLEEYKSLLAVPGREFYNQRILVKTQKAQSEDIEMTEELQKTEDQDMTEAEVAAEEPVSVDVKVVAESSLNEPSEANPSVISTNEDLSDQVDKEGADNELNAAMKRKRKEVEERPGLRTSKRVRDKLEQFEETKRKREEEEHEILAKYRIVLSKFGLDMENAYVSSSTPDCLRPKEIFPSGLSGLLVTFNKHLERPNALVQASTIDHVQQQKTNHFAIFNLEKNEPPVAPFFEDQTTLLDFISKSNEQNSGIVMYLCEYIIAVMFRVAGLESEPNWQKRWPSGLRSVISSIVGIIEEQLLDYLREESWVDEKGIDVEEKMKVELSLSICEMYLDEMVQAILQPYTLVSRKSRSAKKVDTELVAKLDKQFQRWLYLAGLGLDASLTTPAKKGLDSSTFPWMRTASLRFNWMLGRYAQCLGNAADAIARFEDCAQHLKSDSSVIIEMPNCKYDAKVEAERIQERLNRLKTHQYVLDAARLFEEKDYNAVVMRLEPIFLRKEANTQTSIKTDEETMESDIADTIGGSLSERIELMSLLYKSCEALENRFQQIHCITEMFVLVVETLVNTITDKSDATEVWFLFGQIAQTLYLLRETLQSTTLNDLLVSLESRLLQRLVCCVLAIARLGFVNVLHQDRLVDDDIKLSYSDLLRNRPHLEQFNLIVVRVWLVLLLLLPSWIQERPSNIESGDADCVVPQLIHLNMEPLDVKMMELDPETTNRVLSQPLTTNSSMALANYTRPSQELYMEFIALVHDDLGVRGICGIDNNQLIKLALKVSSLMQGAFYRKEENQCYYCFYGISLSVDGQYPIEHSSEPVDFDRTAAIEFFPLLERSLSDKVLRGQVRGDLKDAVDRVEEALGSPPYESNSYLEMNRQIIDNYLASEINFAEAIHLNSRNHLPTMLQPPSSKLPPVYRRIYAIQGKIFLAQFRNKAKNNQFKPLEDLQHAIDQFRTDIHVNPDCWESWYSLAICYTFLADENLVFSASDIKNNFSKITDLQKRSFHCFSQAVRLAPKRTHRGSGHETFTRELESQSGVDMNAVGESQGSSGRERAISEDGESQQGEEYGGKQSCTANAGTDHEWYQMQAAFWFDFGNLIHGIMSKPMRMEAMRRTGGLETMSEAGDTLTIPIPEPTEEQVYKFAAFCFKRSLMLNDQNWRTPLMLGKCIEKLKGKPNQVLALYKVASDKVPHRSGQPGNEKIFEAAYKLISTLSKYLATDKIKPSVVENLMNKALAKTKLSAADRESFIFEPPEEYLQVIQSEPPTEEDARKKEKLHAFRLLCEGLARIRHIDKRHWHHRPVFRQASILYHVYHDVDRAKAGMLSLFQIKSNLKTLVSSVWKPEFERSGKHFIYVGQYTKFLIVLAKESNDVETLNSLARKIRRATGLLLDLKEIWELLYDSYLTVLSNLVGPAPTLAVAEVIPRTEFREKAAIYEARMFEQASRLPGLSVLQRLCELKKLNDKMAPEGEMSHLLTICYSKLFIEVGGAELYPKELVRQLSSNVELLSTMNEGQPEPSVGDSVDGVQGAVVQGDIAAPSKRVQGEDDEDDQEDVRLKIAKLTTEPQPDSSQSAGGANDGLPIIVVDIDGASKNGEIGVEGNPLSNDQHPSSTDTTVLSGAEMPSSPALSSNAKEGDMSSSMDVEPDIEDWKSRKKISAAELASRATIMCKAPPSLVKAPQGLQSRVSGGPESQVSQDESSVAGGPNDESGDIAMTDAERTMEDESLVNQNSSEGVERSEEQPGTESEPSSDNATQDPTETNPQEVDVQDEADQTGDEDKADQQGDRAESPVEGRGSRASSKRVGSRRNSKQEDIVMS